MNGSLSRNSFRAETAGVVLVRQFFSNVAILRIQYQAVGNSAREERDKRKHPLWSSYPCLPVTLRNGFGTTARFHHDDHRPTATVAAFGAARQVEWSLSGAGRRLASKARWSAATEEVSAIARGTHLDVTDYATRVAAHFRCAPEGGRLPCHDRLMCACDAWKTSAATALW